MEQGCKCHDMIQKCRCAEGLKPPTAHQADIHCMHLLPYTFHNNLMHSHTYYIDYHLLTVDIHRYNKHYHLNNNHTLYLYNFLYSFTSPHFYLIINSLTAKERKQMLNMILSQSASTSTSGSSTIFIIMYIFLFALILLIPIGLIFLIYFLIKKLIRYYKTGK